MQSIFMTLRQQGHLEEQTVEQLFSEAAGKFLADRFVSGTCPHPDCQFEVGPFSCNITACVQADASMLSCIMLSTADLWTVHHRLALMCISVAAAYPVALHCTAKA